MGAAVADPIGLHVHLPAEDHGETEVGLCVEWILLANTDGFLPCLAAIRASPRYGVTLSRPNDEEITPVERRYVEHPSVPNDDIVILPGLPHCIVDAVRRIRDGGVKLSSYGSVVPDALGASHPPAHELIRGGVVSSDRE